MAEAPVPISRAGDASPWPPLLTTKLYLPPTRANLVPRPHLTWRLNEGLNRKLTLISAPAGFGKTTLLSEWIPLSPCCVTWVSLDEGDNDPTRFLGYFISAIQMLQNNLGQNALLLLQAPQPPPLELSLTTLLNELTTFPDPFVLVLDDYHLIENSAIHAAITFLLDHMTPQMHLTITTRADPPLPLSRLRGRGQLTELRAADLRFTQAEATVFLNNVMGLAVTAPDIAALEERTEGWIAGLQLAALAMQNRADLSGFVNAFTGSDRFVVDYLAAEVIARQPAHVQTFLLQTSVLDRLCGSLCDTVLGISEASPGGNERDILSGAYSQLLLEELERANLFIVPLDNERGWYRYHHLFAEVMRGRLISGATAETIMALHHRASLWYERHGLIAEAIQHALAAGEAERAASLIEQASWSLLGRGEARTLHRWLDALPVETVRTRPRLCLAYAWIFALLEQAEAIEPCLLDAETALANPASHPPEQPAEVDAILGQIATLRAEIALNREDIPVALELCRQALELLPADNLMLRGVATYFLGHGQRRAGQMVQAERVYAEASALGLETDNLLLALHALANLTSVQITRGCLRLAADTSRRILEITAERQRQSWPVTGLAYQGLGRLHYEWSQLDTAADNLRLGIEFGQRGDLTGLEINSRGALAFTLQAQGDATGADEMLRQIAALTERRHHPVHAATVARWEARLRLRQGRLDAPIRWAETCGLRTNDSTWPYRSEAGYLTLVRVRLAQGNGEGISHLLAQLQQAAEAELRMGSLTEILILTGLASQANGDSAGALAALASALALAEPEGYVRTFLDEGEPMVRLLREAQRRGIMPGYAAKLLAAFETGGAAPGIGGAGAAPSPILPLIETLTERELELLRLVATGRSNQEIAQELFLAVGTVKKHLNNIFGKLGANSRTQAIARGRELNLL
jgi:LuxR family maltose regulon positive regulatory protein